MLLQLQAGAWQAKRRWFNDPGNMRGILTNPSNNTASYGSKTLHIKGHRAECVYVQTVGHIKRTEKQE